MKNDRNPYNGFKNDRDRRLALLAKEVCFVIAVVAAARPEVIPSVVGVVRYLAQAAKWWP